MHISKLLSREFLNLVLSSSNRYISQDYLYHILFYAALPFELDKSACVRHIWAFHHTVSTQHTEWILFKIHSACCEHGAM